jgi:hypothetical protein
LVDAAFDPTHPVIESLEPGESIHRMAATDDFSVVLTDRRLAVATGDRIALNVPFERLRRVQFDLERGRPATLVLVPDHPRDEPQVLGVPVDHYDSVAGVVAEIGRRIYDLD